MREFKEEILTGNIALCGVDPEQGIVAVEFQTSRQGDDKIIIYSRIKNELHRREESFRPFIAARKGILDGCPVPYDAITLQGAGVLDTFAEFSSWREWDQARKWLPSKIGGGVGSPGAPVLAINDPVQQYLIITGKTLFKGMVFADVVRMQIDIECTTTPGFEFCNAEREGDRIIAIGMADSTGWECVLSGKDMDEKTMLSRFVELVSERDPDVIEGHNIFNFDLPYIFERAKRNRVKLKIGRDGSVPSHRSSRHNVAERTLAYERFEVFGRHIADTLFMVHAYDVTHRSLPGFGLKEVARYFGVAAKNRTYIDGDKIASEYVSNPDLVNAYVLDDVKETAGISGLLSGSYFVQAKLLPYSYQNTLVRGNATKIDALMIREYIRRKAALPVSAESREFVGGYTDIFIQGVVPNVHHCDVRSLYPSLMLSRKIQPSSDKEGVFLGLLKDLTVFRVAAKGSALSAKSADTSFYYGALQSAFKILINSFYGYLGFSQGRFSDFDAANKVASSGREILTLMMDWLRKNGATPVEADTDGVYFVPPAPVLHDEKERDSFRSKMADHLPEGIEIEFDGEYRSMFSYKMKNYALLDMNGEITIKGAALKSRGLEPFLRDFLEEVIRLKLEEKDSELPALQEKYLLAIRAMEWDIVRLAKTETLQDSVASYQKKISGKSRGRNAAYELAIKSERDYRQGDQISYYVAGKGKRVRVFESAKLVSDFDVNNRDENVEYYADKLIALYEKFSTESAQGEFDLDA